MAALLIALGILAASLTLQVDSSAENDVPNWFRAIQPIARPAALLIFVLAIVITLGKIKRCTFRGLTGPAAIVWLVNIYLIIKTYYWTVDLDFLILATGTALVQIILFVTVNDSEVREKILVRRKRGLMTSVELGLFLFAVFFCILNFALLAFNPDFVTTSYGRFFGTTANPQHTMMVAVLSIPICILAVRNESKGRPFRLAALCCLIALLVILYLTGSRTGLIAGTMVLAIGFADLFSDSRLLLAVYALTVLASVWVMLVDDSFLQLIGVNFYDTYIGGREDTRSFVWEREFREFMRNPVFGVPVGPEGRLMFAETYWLSVMSNGGIMGLIFLVYLLISMIDMSFKIANNGAPAFGKVRSRVYLASIVAILILSMAESLLAAILAPYTILATAYLGLSSPIVDGVERPVRRPGRRPILLSEK